MWSTDECFASVEYGNKLYLWANYNIHLTTVQKKIN